MTDARVTQEALEVWSDGAPVARVTSVFVEHWGSAGTTTPLAVTTLVALEMWLTVAPPSRGGPMVSMIW